MSERGGVFLPVDADRHHDQHQATRAVIEAPTTAPARSRDIAYLLRSAVLR